MDLDKRSRNRLLSVLFLGVLMGALDIAIVGPALPTIRAAFGIDARTAAWVFAMYVLFNLIGNPLMAKLSDAFGRRSIYVLDVLLFALGSSIVALSPTFSVLLAGRAVQGLGAGGIFPVASAVIGDTFPPERRGSALGLIGAVFGLAFLLGPMLAGIVLYFFNWHWLFLINLPVALVVILLALRLVPAARPEMRRPFDWVGMAVLSVFLAALSFAINHLDAAHLGRSLLSVEVWPFLALTLVSLPVFVSIERRAEDPVVHLLLFTSKQVVLASVLALGAGLAESSTVFVPDLLVHAFSVTTSQASFMLLPIVLAMAFGSPTFGRMLDKMGSKRVVQVATALLTLGLLMVGLLPITLAMFYSAAILVGLGLSGLLGATLRYIMLSEAPRSERAAAQGILSLFTSIGQLIGGVFVGAMATSRGGGVSGYQFAFAIMGGVVLFLWLSATQLKAREAELATARERETVVEQP